VDEIWIESRAFVTLVLHFAGLLALEEKSKYNEIVKKICKKEAGG